MRIFVSTIICVFMLSGCGKTSTSTTASKKTNKAKSAVSKGKKKIKQTTKLKLVKKVVKAPTKAGPVEFADLGIKGDAPGARVRKLGKSTMVQSAVFVATVKLAGSFDAKDGEAAKKEAASSYKAQDTKIEKLADGWVATFQNKGSMGTNYFVWARREIGGKSIFCSTTASKPSQQAGAVAFCKSLRK